MNFNRIESFLKVVEYKSFSIAARELYLTQPTISNNVKSLENELKTTLLNRKNKNITLTHSGKIFYKYARELINIKKQAKFEVEKGSNEIEGRLSLDFSSELSQDILPYMIRDFTIEYPSVSYSINSMKTKDILLGIVEGKRDFGIIGSSCNCHELDSIKFYEDKLVLAVPNSFNHHMIDEGAIRIESLVMENFICRKKGSRIKGLITETLLEKNLDFNDFKSLYFVDDNETIKKMVELGLAISFISPISIINEVKDNLIKTIKVENLDLVREFYFVYPKNRTLPPIIEAFKNFLVDWPGIETDSKLN